MEQVSGVMCGVESRKHHDLSRIINLCPKLLMLLDLVKLLMLHEWLVVVEKEKVERRLSEEVLLVLFASNPAFGKSGAKVIGTLVM